MLSDLRELNKLTEAAKSQRFFENEAFHAWLTIQDMGNCSFARVVTYTTGGITKDRSYSSTAYTVISKICNANRTKLIYCKQHRGLLNLLRRFDRTDFIQHPRNHTKLYLFEWADGKHDLFLGSLNLGTTATTRNVLVRLTDSEAHVWAVAYFNNLWAEAQRLGQKPGQ